MVLGKKHLGGPGHPDCEGDIEVKAHRACITRPTVIKEAEKGRRVIVAKCFTKPAVEGARGLGVELREWKHGKEN